MADTGPAGPLPRDPFENLISIVAGPIAAVIRSFDQLRRGSDELLNGLENFNRTMENLNVTAERVNGLLNEFEEPVRAILPQVMRTVNLAEDVANRVSAPIDQVVPGLTRLADTLNSPVITSLPDGSRPLRRGDQRSHPPARAARADRRVGGRSVRPAPARDAADLAGADAPRCRGANGIATGAKEGGGGEEGRTEEGGRTEEDGCTEEEGSAEEDGEALTSSLSAPSSAGRVLCGDPCPPTGRFSRPPTHTWWCRAGARG